MAKPFIEIPQEQLYALAGTDDGVERVIRYVHAARRVGRPELAADALIIVISAQEWIVRGYVKKGLPDEEVEDVTAGAIEALVRAVHANPPNAATIAQLRAWIRVVVERYRAGFYRKKGEQIRMKETISVEYAFEDTGKGFNPDEDADDPAYESIAYMEIVQKHFDNLSGDHQVVIGYSVFGNMTSKEVSEILAEKHGLDFKPNNIDQIASRFRRNCRGDLEEQ